MVHPHDIFEKNEPWTVRIVNIAEKFKLKGAEVKLVYFDYNGKSTKTCFLNGIETVSLSRKCGIFNYIKIFRKIFHFVKTADIVHFQKCFHYVSIPVIFNCFIQRKPVHYDWDDSETAIYHYGKPASRLVGFFICLLEYLIPKTVDSISAASDKLMERALTYGIKKNKLVKAPVGADLNVFNPSNENRDNIRKLHHINCPMVMYLGQLHGAQYTEIFLHSIKYIVTKYPDVAVSFMIIGGGSRFEELKKTAENLGITDRIIFTGFILHKEVPSYISASDVCVACFEENNITICKSPLKIAEYMASGKPIVASGIGEIRNMAGGAGLITKPSDHIDLAENIVKAVKDKKLSKRMGCLARQKAEKIFNWENTSNNILSVYQKK